MQKKIGFLMDPLESIKPYKDTTFAFMLSAQKRGHAIFYFTVRDLWLEDGVVYARMHEVALKDSEHHYFEIINSQIQPLHKLDLVLMRKDPPFNMDYIYATYLLELAENNGLRVLNKPQSLRDANEKLFSSYFPQCCPPTFVSSDINKITVFIAQFDEAIVKPLDGMGGNNIYRVNKNSVDLVPILNKMTNHGQQFIMAQSYIPEIVEGDKRIILINGEPIGYALARIPAANDFRGNLAQGARGVVQKLTKRDLWICQQVGASLRQKGLYFVGLDVIGDYLTEINVTSPTGLREIERETKLDIGAMFFEGLGL